MNNNGGLVNRIKLQLLQQINRNIKHVYSVGEIPKLEIALNLDEQFGDFTSTAALQIQSIVKESPKIIGDKILRPITLENETVKKIEIAPSGHINFFLDPRWRIKVIDEIIKNSLSYGNQILPPPQLLDDICYINQRIHTIVKTFEEEGFTANCEKILWEHLNPGAEKELVSLLICISSKTDLQTLNRKDRHMLLEELILKFYNYHDLIQFRKLDDTRLNVILNVFLCVSKILSAL